MMTMQMSLTIAAVLLLAHVGHSNGACWTRWYNHDHPSGTGDWEVLSELIKENPGGDLCAQPVSIEAVTVNGEIPAAQTGQVFLYYSPTIGFVCRNQDQSNGFCQDYKVRFGCLCR